jgi:FkbM family methyltransferase
MKLISTLRTITKHPLTIQSPGAAVWRFVRWQIRSRLASDVVVPWIGESRAVVRNGMTGFTGNIYCGLHEFVDMAFTLHFLRPDDLFVDIGANVGSYTILAAKVCGARAIAFEPDPQTNKRLVKNVEINEIGELVTSVQMALGDASDTVAFTTGKDTTNRIASADDQDTQQVPLARLDDVLGDARPQLIKIDVEGYESEVLKGASETLRQNELQAIISESTSEAVREILRGFGFSRVYYDPRNRQLLDAPALPAKNGIFVKDRALCAERVVAAPRFEVLGRQF